MKMTLENLLNTLIQKGWKPFGVECTLECVKTLCNQPYRFKHLDSGFSVSTRELASKESGLREFACENGMVKMKEGYYWQEIFPLDSIEYEYVDYEYRLIESSLENEDDLEQFLLDNIKIGNYENGKDELK